MTQACARNSLKNNCFGMLQARNLIDYRRVLTAGGNGGDGCISLLRIFANEFAGPDGGDGGSGGHVVFHVSKDITVTLSSYIQSFFNCLLLFSFRQHEM